MDIFPKCQPVLIYKDLQTQLLIPKGQKVVSMVSRKTPVYHMLLVAEEQQIMYFTLSHISLFLPLDSKTPTSWSCHFYFFFY